MKTQRNRENIKNATKRAGLMIGIMAAPFLAMAGSPAGPATPSACRPTWTVGDWWTVDSQRFDRGENRSGATPQWLEKESWKFSVDATNVVDGEPCFQVSVRPRGQTASPYWFDYSFRRSDLLIMRRVLHQPAVSKTGRSNSSSVVEYDYSQDGETPFVQADFPNLPLTVPQFAGGSTNSYRAATLSQGGAPTRARLAPKCSRSPSAATSQSVSTSEKMSFDLPIGAKALVASPGAATDPGAGVITLSTATDRFERQSWDRSHPWHVYAEKWEFGDLVRRSWLSDAGHAEPASNNDGGVK